MSACKDRLLLLQAHADGELDAAHAFELEAHLRACADCAAELARIEALRTILAAPDLRDTAPESLRGRVESMLVAAPQDGVEAHRRPDPRPVQNPPRFGLAASRTIAIGRSWSGGLVAGLALSLALVFALPQLTRQDTQDQLIANHIRSLALESHLTDVATSNRHMVKPWFNGKIDFAPPVPELAVQGFPLVGGRLDYLDGRAVAALVYKRQLHTINVFVRPAGATSLPTAAAISHDSYNLIRWTNRGLEFWAVSDVEMSELKHFQRAFADQPSL